MDKRWIRQTARVFRETAESLSGAARQFGEDQELFFNSLLDQQYAVNQLIRAMNAPPISAGLPVFHSSMSVSEIVGLAHRLSGVCHSYEQVSEALTPEGPTVSPTRSIRGSGKRLSRSGRLDIRLQRSTPQRSR